MTVQGCRLGRGLEATEAPHSYKLVHASVVRLLPVSHNVLPIPQFLGLLMREQQSLKSSRYVTEFSCNHACIAMPLSSIHIFTYNDINTLSYEFVNIQRV